MTAMPMKNQQMPWLFGGTPNMGGFQFMGNPLLNIGLGILAANRPGVSAGQAIGQGAFAGINAIQRAQQFKSDAELAKLRADSLKSEIERAKEQAELENELRSLIRDPNATDEERMQAAMSLAGPASYLSQMRHRQERADTRAHRERGYEFQQQAADLAAQRFGLDKQKARDAQNRLVAEQELQAPYTRALTQKALADAAMTMDKTENPERYRTTKLPAMPSPTKMDIGRATTAINSDPDLNLLDDEGKQRASETIASAAKALQKQGVRADVALQMAVTELKASGGFARGEEVDWWFDKAATYNPYTAAPAAAAPAAAAPGANVVDWSTLPRGK